MGSAGGLGSVVSSPSRVWGGAPAEIEFGAFLAVKSDIMQVATISIIFNAMQTTNFKVKNIWGGNASPCL